MFCLLGKGSVNFCVFKYYLLNINYLVNILNECLHILSTAASFLKPITTCCLVLPPEIVMHAAYISGHFRWMKITHKRGRKPAIISSFLVLPPEIVMHDDAYIGGR